MRVSLVNASPNAEEHILQCARVQVDGATQKKKDDYLIEEKVG